MKQQLQTTPLVSNPRWKNPHKSITTESTITITKQPSSTTSPRSSELNMVVAKEKVDHIPNSGLKGGMWGLIPLFGMILTADSNGEISVTEALWGFGILAFCTSVGILHGWYKNTCEPEPWNNQNTSTTINQLYESDHTNASPLTSSHLTTPRMNLN